MPKERGAYQHALEMVTLDSLVPADHLLRQIDASIEFDFIRDNDGFAVITIGLDAGMT